MMINNGVSFGNVLPKLSHDFLFGHGSMSSQGDQDFDAAGFDPAISHFLHQSRQDLLYRCGPGIVINDDQKSSHPPSISDKREVPIGREKALSMISSSFLSICMVEGEKIPRRFLSGTFKGFISEYGKGICINNSIYDDQLAIFNPQFVISTYRDTNQSKGRHPRPVLQRGKLQRESRKALDSPVSSTGQASSSPE